ncbi:bifunctional diaminohydroxyphosphoribosylaminopyrimidine deaminase/5-amino-6-(5-phosphoribosylamino)uracil reductase RibD [Nonomuraea sediminis]|uniref:bifunctional diaminohydroxyphosphoribosylaminopyrimidine deaminase/5-amino-6-(5-phosphoribosylamino)uracil reductase RibD n=1 Tax=Nonomuraea sediminis TaxID=2835864 RepID=UPI0027E196D6|nr:bifunctional diaminohydroxyphosphoribosylaminopyrimidine deaminase/5-amino-6-(5-phosphoribosylamino)uracil reductase RibD [Nonomuraea sediminis]
MEYPTQPGDDVAHMRRAVELAARGCGTTSPNPVVGCVITDKQGALAGEGFHAYAGGPHAEIVALAQAGERARGGTAYVTLEPCDHTGRTGPCSRALLEAGVTRVVVAVADPNPAAAGGGARLRAHGVTVETGLLAEEAERVNVEWLTYVRLGRPHVTWKFAATLDGRSAAEDGTSKWITSPEARADVHRLRAASDAIMAGIGTILADDPHLTARIPSTPTDAPEGTGPQPGTESRAAQRGGVPRRRVPLRVVVDSDGRTPRGARVLDGAAPTLVVVADDAVTDLEADVVRLPRHDPHAVLKELARRDVVSVFLEGGPTLAGAFLAAGLVDRVVAYLAPALLGGGAAALGDAGVRTIAHLHRLTFDDISQIGPDLRLTARPAAPPTPSREQ